VGGGKYVLSEKLVQTLLSKKNYVVHYRTLQLYTQLGIKITKIHGALKFRQSAWMKPFIEENIRKRKIAKAKGDEFGVMYYKLKNNAVYGKQMENVRKHMRVELVRPDQDKKLRRLISSPLYVGFREFSGGIIAVHMLKSQVTLNKPMFVGQAILDISKLMMFNFWYGYIQSRYGEKAKMIYVVCSKSFDTNIYFSPMYIINAKIFIPFLRNTLPQPLCNVSAVYTNFQNILNIPLLRYRLL